MVQWLRIALSVGPNKVVVCLGDVSGYDPVLPCGLICTDRGNAMSQTTTPVTAVI
jgi:hypothetical protein